MMKMWHGCALALAILAGSLVAGTPNVKTYRIKLIEPVEDRQQSTGAGRL